MDNEFTFQSTTGSWTSLHLFSPTPLNPVAPAPPWPAAAMPPRHPHVVHRRHSSPPFLTQMILTPRHRQPTHRASRPAWRRRGSAASPFIVGAPTHRPLQFWRFVGEMEPPKPAHEPPKTLNLSVAASSTTPPGGDLAVGRSTTSHPSRLSPACAQSGGATQHRWRAWGRTKGGRRRWGFWVVMGCYWAVAELYIPRLKIFWKMYRISHQSRGCRQFLP
jgi:hypothetical protein